MGQETLTKDDLLNMMDSYKSNVEFNKELMSSQEIVIDEQGKIIERLADITKSQEVLARYLEDMIKNLTAHDKACGDSITDASSSLKEVNTKIDSNKIENIKEHGVLRNHLMGISGGLVVIIIALVMALEKIWSKADIIDEVAKFIGM